MTDEAKIWNQIEDYFSGNMGRVEKDAFEKAISSDTELADRIEAYKLTENVAVVHEALKLKAQMDFDMAEPKSGHTKYWLMAAIGAGIGLGVYFMYSSPKSAPKEKAAKDIEKVDSIIVVDKTEINTSSEIKSEKKIELPASKPKIAQKELQISEPEYVAETKEVTKPTLAPTENQSEPKPMNQPKIDPCVGLKINLDFYTLPSCKGQNTGELHVKPKSVKGGIAPYIYSFSPDKDFESSTIKEKGAGNYQLFVKDGNECVVAVAKPVVITNINCETTTKEFTYSPLHDPAWAIPYDADKSARSIKIVNKGGKEVFQSLVRSGNPTEWNGESNTGILIETGYYLYFIEYSDGTLDKGTISILR